jgi:Fe-S-cluster containining protein
MQCRVKCGACCEAPSISSPIPGMSNGKPAGVACIHLSDDYQCLIYDRLDRPKVCNDFQADPEVCGTTRREAMVLLGALEQETSASGSS